MKLILERWNTFLKENEEDVDKQQVSSPQENIIKIGR
jgi:hypothetical protein